MNIQTVSKNLALLLKKARRNLQKYIAKEKNRKNTAKKIASIRRKYNRRKYNKNNYNRKKYKQNTARQSAFINHQNKSSQKYETNTVKRNPSIKEKDKKSLPSPKTAPLATEIARLQKEQTLTNSNPPASKTSQNPAPCTNVPNAATSIPALNASCLAAPSPITQLPTKIFVHQIGQPETTIGWWLTVEMLNELIGQYLNGYISRLALSWGDRELVLLHNKGKHDITLNPDRGTYACLFFDNKNLNWYALVSLPEVYAVVESSDVVYVPFGLGTLPNYMVHDNTNRIKQHLNEIVTMAANPNGSPAFMTWSPQCYRFETYPRYHIAKRLYGGYSAEQEPCRINAKFYIPTAPIRLSYADCARTQSNYAYKPRNKSEVQEALVTYMMGKLSLLILSWHFQDNDTSENSTQPNRHIILVQDQGHHQMLYLDKKYLCYLVSDVNEYMNAEGNHYRKVVFQSNTVPAYLVHEDLCRIRDYTDLLLAQIAEPNAILNLFGEFSYHGEDYDAIMEEFFANEKL